MKKRVSVKHFTMKIIRTYLYVNCNTKILFVKKYLSLLWVPTDFSILLDAAMTTDDDDDDEGDMMIAQCLRWEDEVGWCFRHCDAVLSYWPDETAEGSSGSSSSEGGEDWTDENDDSWMTSGADVDGRGSLTVDPFFLELVEERRNRELLLLLFQFIKHLLEKLQGFRYHTCNLNATFRHRIIIHYFFP